MFQRIGSTLKGCCTSVVLATNVVVVSSCMMPIALLKLVAPREGRL